MLNSSSHIPMCPDAEFGFADGAKQMPARMEAEDKDDFSPCVKAALAEIVLRLRGEWIDGPAKSWGAIHPIRELPLSDLEQRVVGALVQGFGGFSKLLCQLEMIILESQKLGVVREQSVLSLEKLVVHSVHFRDEDAHVPQRHGAAEHVFGGVDGRNGAGDEGEVHGK